MKIFITGGTGFLGSYVVRSLLADGHKLLLLSRAPYSRPAFGKNGSGARPSFLRGDLSDIGKYTAKIKKFRPEVGLHLAWEDIPKDDAKTNIKNLLNGLRYIETLAEAGCKAVIVSGSCHEYGEPGIKVSESSPLRPFNALYAAKVALYWLGSKIAAEHGMKFIWTRIFFLYGPGQRSQSLIPYLVGSIKEGRAPSLKNPNGGNDFVYVEDAARALQMIVRKSKTIPSAVYNIGSGKLTGVADILKLAYRSCGKSLPATPAKPHKRATSGFYADIRKIRREIGWRPKVSLSEGIKRTVAYFKNL